MTTAQFYALPDEERDYQIAQWDIEQETCREHGGPRSECGDQHKVWYPQRTVCYATMELAAANAKYDELYGEKFHDGTFLNWSESRSSLFPYGHRDGVSLWVAPVDVNPDDTFLGGEKQPGPNEPHEGRDEGH